MRHRRSPFSIVWLMALVAVLGVELTALISDSWLGDFLAFNVTTVVLIFASFAARFGDKGSMAFWFGFAILGWSQFVLGMLLLEINYGDEGKLPTNRLTIGLMNSAIPATLLGKANPDVNRRYDKLSDMYHDPRFKSALRWLYQKANAVASIGIAVVGGVLGQFLGSRKEGRDPG
jgi:hypothetical protein